MSFDKYYRYRKLLDWDDWVYAVELTAFKDNRPIRISYDVVDPLDFKAYPDIQLEGKICTARLWLWLKILNSMY